MNILYHIPFSPFCRKVRLVLHELGIEFTSRIPPVEAEHLSLLSSYPPPELPVLILPLHKTVHAFCGHDVICEIAHSLKPKNTLMGTTAAQQGVARRFMRWFDTRFYEEVIHSIFGEKVDKHLTRRTEPNASVIIKGYEALRKHLADMEHTLKHNSWLAGETLSIADLTAACHISALDYLGDIPWKNFPMLKNWYCCIKCRPSFQPFLQERILRIRPSPHYNLLDF